MTLSLGRTHVPSASPESNLLVADDLCTKRPPTIQRPGLFPKKLHDR